MDWLQGDTDMAQRIRSYPWERTPLGPMGGWPDVLKTTVVLILASRFPQAVVWGPGLVTLHNDAFARILGNKAEALGAPFSDVWSEAWRDIQPMAERAFDGQATYIENFPLPVDRGGAPGTGYFTFCYSPIRDSQGRVVGMLDTVTETTETVIANHRLEFLDQLGRAVADATHPDAIMGTTTRLVGEHMALSNCAYADMDFDEDGFTIRGDWFREGSPSIVGHYSLTAFGERAVRNLKAGVPLVINDNLTELPASEAATFQAIGITATVCMPLVKDGRLTALMAMHDNVPRIWDPAELALIREVTERSWAHIERVRADARVREAAGALAALNASLEKQVSDRTQQLLTAESALRQSQKLEAVGQLTGGIAHDFNNLLTIIRSSIDLLKRPELTREKQERYLRTVSETVDRAAKLTSQLLAFARRQALKPEVIEVTGVLAVMADALSQTVSHGIEIKPELPTFPCYAKIDPSQFEIALTNLVANALDAMPRGGTLRLAVQCGVEKPMIRGHAGASGPFIAIEVTDTGIGITSDHVAHVFEPFFTTKGVGKGTGLGLSQVYGFAKQSGGDVDVASILNDGSTFTLYLPEASLEPARMAETVRPTIAHLAQNAGQRILIVEDNLEVGEFASQILADLGYEMVWAKSAEEALDWIDRNGERFDAVFSDVMMPGIGGLALARELRRRYRDLPIVLTSGYSDVLVREGHDGFEFLRKPYSAEEVSRMLSAVIAGSG